MSKRKSTGKAAEAIAQFVGDNAHKFEIWLDQVANGVKAENGGVLTRPDPARAFELLKDLLEYHLPKLARTEVSGSIDHRTITERSDAELEAVAFPSGAAPGPKANAEHLH